MANYDCYLESMSGGISNLKLLDERSPSEGPAGKDTGFRSRNFALRA